jgi:hypothetical protein
MTIDHESEYEAAYTAARALWDGLTEREMRDALDVAGLEGGCETRWEILAFLDNSLGADLRAAI